MNKQDPTNNGKGYINCSTLEELRQLTRFTPVTNKRPYLKQWQKNPKTLAYCENEIKNGRANGYGLITGNGLLAIDFDGGNAHQIAKVIAHWLVEIDTLAWTSGKPLRKQILVIIPSHRLKDFEKLSRKALNSFGDVEAVENEQLEIRYNRCQSVLPPSAHPETKGYYWLSDSDIKIVELNDYQCNTILSALDTDTISNTKKYHGLTNSQQQLKLLESALEFIPSDNHFDWILVGMAIKHGGYDCSLWDSWSSNSTKYEIGKCEKTWQSFNGTGTTIRTLFWLAKQYGFNQKQWYKDNLPPYRNTHNIRHNLDKTYDNSSDEVNELDISKLIDDLVNRLAQPEISEAKRKLEITKFVSLYRVSSSIIEKAIDEKLIEDYQQQELESIALNIDNLINVPYETLPIIEIFDEYFTLLLEQIAKEIPTNPEAIITILLPAIASIIGTRSRIIVNPYTDYIQPFAIRTMIVAKSGKKKTPTAKVALKALRDKNIKEAQIYQEKYQNYLEDLAEWEKTPKDERGDRPIEPLQKRYIIQDSTIDGMLKAHKENPKGFLVFVDELNGYFNRMNKFTRGGGDDLERDLELYNGGEVIKTRASKDSNIFLERTAISVTGTIQDVAVETLFANDNDLKGITARWLIWCGEMPDGLLSDRKPTTKIFFDFLEGIFNYIDDLEFSDLLIDDEAYELFKSWQHGVIKAIKQVNLPQIEAKHAKIEGEVIRIAGILHYFLLAINPDVITNKVVINFETMRRAILLGNHFLRHFAYICTKSNDDLLEGILVKILKIVERKGECTAGQIHSVLGGGKCKLSSKEVGEYLLTLVSMGKLKRVPTKKGVRVKIER